MILGVRTRITIYTKDKNMGFKIKDIFGSAAADLIEVVGEAIDKNVTSKEERLAAENEVVKVLTDFELTVDAGLTERLKIDMTSDSWLSKNVRPLSLIGISFIVILLSVTDGNLGNFTVGEEYIGLYKSLAGLMFSFYFGSRGVEKIMKTIKK